MLSSFRMSEDQEGRLKAPAAGSGVSPPRGASLDLSHQPCRPRLAAMLWDTSRV